MQLLLALSESGPAAMRLGIWTGIFVLGLAMARAALPFLERQLLGPRVESKAVCTWGAAEVLIVVGVFLVSAKVGFTILFFAGEESPIDGLIATDIGLLSGACFAAGLAWQSAGRRSVGPVFGWLPKQPIVKPLVFGAAALAATTPALLGLMLLTPALFSALGYEPAPQDVLMNVLSQRGASLALAVLLASIVGPMLEEFLFRGFLQPVLKQQWGVPIGLVATSFIFAAIHGLDAGIPIFLLSLLLGYLRERTGRLAVPILVHCMWNAGTLLLTLSI